MPALNITSFLDMSFCLLTFLILSASFSSSEGALSAKLPSDPTEQAGPPEKELRIHVSSNGGEAYRIAIEGFPEATADFRTLTDQLTRLQFSDRNPSGVYRATNPIIILADTDTRWQHSVNAFNSVIAAKYQNVSFGNLEHAN